MCRGELKGKAFFFFETSAPLSQRLPEMAAPPAKKADPLTPATIRNLHDKLYDKRKLGALEVEQLVKELLKQGDTAKIMEVILYLHETFLKSTSIGSRKGGLIAMAAAALGLGTVRWLFHLPQNYYLFIYLFIVYNKNLITSVNY